MGSFILGKEYFSFPEVCAYVESESQEESRLITALKVAQPGDLLLVKTPGSGYELGRRLTRNIYDHVAVVINDGKTLNIVSPRTVILPILYFAKPARCPILLRPKWRSPEQAERFVEEMSRFEKTSYNLRKTIIGVITSTLYGWLGIRIPMKKPLESDETWICTEAILVSLIKSFPDFEAINNIKLDYNNIGFATTSDFFRICRDRPDILEVLRL